MRILFAGTPSFAAAALTALINSEHQVEAVLTQPDRPAGRGRKLSASAVKMVANAANIRVLQPHSLKDDDVKSTLQSLDFDVAVVAAYGLMIPDWLLQQPRHGCINIHASLLPRWRGAAPIQRAIEAGDSETGITIMQMEQGLDTGPILLQASLPILPHDTGATIHDQLASLGATTVLNALEQLPLAATAQDNALSCYANKLSKADAQLNWQLSNTELHNSIRAFNPFPIAHTIFNNQTIRIWQSDIVINHQDHGQPGEIIDVTKSGLTICCGKGTLIVTRLQLAGKKALPFADILNGNPTLFAVGQRFQ